MLKLFLIIISLNLSIQFPEAPQNLLWPYPKQFTFNESNSELFFIIPYELSISIPNHEKNLKLQSQLTDIFDFYNSKVFQRSINWTEYKTLNNSQKFCTLILEINNSSLDYPSFETNETYEIDITSPTKIFLRSENYIGILRAIETFTQLLQYDQIKQLYFISGIPIYIHDSPDYHYRSIMVDTSRHFIPKADLLRTFDAMMMNKLNVFH